MVFVLDKHKKPLMPCKYVDFDESFLMYNLNYVNNTFETREEALAMLTVIAKKLDAVNYTEEEFI